MVFKSGLLQQPVTLSAGWAMKNQISSWIQGQETFDSKGQKVKRFYFDRKGRLQYEKERGFVNPPSVLRGIASTRKGSETLQTLLGEGIMNFPKPVELLTYLINLVAYEDDIVLDFFAGSGTTAQAVMELNKDDCRNRKFILVQLPENTTNKQFPTIADITRERVRRVIQRMNEADAGKLLKEDEVTLDRGFKSFHLAASNFKVWNDKAEATDMDALASQLELFADNLLPDATPESILFEILLKAGYDLNVSRTEIMVAGQPVQSIANGHLLVCLERDLSREVVDGMIAQKPHSVICLDEAFHGDDALLTNTLLQMQDAGIIFQTI